jgi:hypothetical protein
MNPIPRFLIGLPFAFPMLAFATWLDFMLAPVSHKIEGDPPKDIAEAAFKILGV